MVGRVVLTEAFKAALCLKHGVAAMRRNSFAEAIRQAQTLLSAALNTR